jgi:hypothetical protein
MTDRDSSSGGMTGATGDLTPDDAQRDFEPGEWREASDPAHQGDVTRSHASHAASERGNVAGDEPAAGPEAEPPTAGGETGEARQPRLGGDASQDHEDHF